MAENQPDVRLQLGLLGLFPPTVRAAALEDKVFRDGLNFHVDAAVSLDGLNVTFRRSQLYKMVRDLLSGSVAHATLNDEDSCAWQMGFDAGGKHLLIARDGLEYALPNFDGLAVDKIRRLSWYDREVAKLRIHDDRSKHWRSILYERPLEDEEVEQLFDEFRCTRIFVEASLSRHLSRQTIDVKTLVPSDIRYYERLVGQYIEGMDLRRFFDSVVNPAISDLLRQDPHAGLKDALLFSAHSFGPQSIPLESVSRDTTIEVFRWLEAAGDRISQVGAIEYGLANLGKIPELEPYLVSLIRSILSDMPNDEAGRLSLTSGLIVLVDGELSRLGICRDLPPFWRRFASITHASVLERAIVGIGRLPPDFSDWAMQTRAVSYFMQTFIDMRLEPRWLPDFITPNHLQAEFISRIANAAHSASSAATTAELRELIDGGEKSVQRRVQFPLAFLPGPLEGGVAPLNQIPRDIENSLRQSLEDEKLTPSSFAALVNSALIFHIDSSLAQLAAEGLRRVKYQLRQLKSQDEAFALIIGLATVASVTRNADLAEEVRTLMRVVRRKSGADISPQNATRIALVAATAHTDIAQWSKYIGECMTEFAFEDMSHDEAVSLRGSLTMLRDLEPRLWAATAKAEAANSAIIEAAVGTGPTASRT